MLLFFLVAVFSFLIQLILPWWSMAIAAFIVSFGIGKKPLATFLSGFCACGMVWLLYALFIHFTRGDLMTARMAQLFTLPSSWLLYLNTSLLAAIIGGFSAWAGVSLKPLLRK